MPDPYEMDFDEAQDYGDPLGDDDDEYEDCGLMPDGQCTKAGSEECDWECGALHPRATGVSNLGEILTEEDDG